METTAVIWGWRSWNLLHFPILTKSVRSFLAILCPFEYCTFLFFTCNMHIANKRFDVTFIWRHFNDICEDTYFTPIHTSHHSGPSRGGGETSSWPSSGEEARARVGEGVRPPPDPPPERRWGPPPGRGWDPPPERGGALLRGGGGTLLRRGVGPSSRAELFLN